jgi:hypothetical protein
MAKHHLVETVSNYKKVYGDSHVDYSKIAPEEYQSMVWWLLPNLVQKELQDIENPDFETLEMFTKGK